MTSYPSAGSPSVGPSGAAAQPAASVTDYGAAECTHDRSAGDAFVARHSVLASERTPLLSSTPVGRPSLLSSSPFLRRGIEDDQRTMQDEERDLALLSAVTTGTGLGMEPETVPATANTPDEYGDFKLPEDTDLRVKPALEDVEDGDLLMKHSGITKGQFWVIFSAILIANFVGAYDSTVLASTHTSVTASFDSAELASWLSTSFLLTCTSFQPLYGRVSDVIGRKIPFVASSALFTISTVACAIAPNIHAFIAARAICGLGAGGMLTMGAIVLSDMLPIEIRGTYQSINNLAYGTGSALGAATGGYLADHLGWRWEFGIQVPFGIFCIVVSAIIIPSTPGAAAKNGDLRSLSERFKGFDFAGSFYLTSSIAFLILGMSLGGNILPWGDWRVLSSLLLAAVLGVILVRVEKKAQSPVLPLQLITSAPRGTIMMNNMLVMLAMNGIIFNLPLYFQAVKLESASKAGTRMLIPSLAGTAGSVASGFVITYLKRVDVTLYSGSALFIFGAALMCFMTTDLPDWLYFPFMIPSNLGYGLALPSGIMTVLICSTQADQAVATSTLIMFRCLGNVFGVATSSLIIQNCLVYFLDANVTGPNRLEIIDKVRSNVQAIFALDPTHQAEVIKSYESSLRYCFMFTLVVALVAKAIMLKIKLPPLKAKDERALKEHSTTAE